MSRPFPAEGIQWEDDARQGWLSSHICRQASMRFRKSMAQLAEAHADWWEQATVTQEDVKAAVEVTWMTREGW